MKKRATLIGLLCLLTCTCGPMPVFGQEGLVQVHQDFSQDPGWEWKNNRIVAEDPPTIKQDFGWTPTDHSGPGTGETGGTGEIGGTVWLSRTPAYYALPLNRPLSFNDKFSFSCRIAF